MVETICRGEAPVLSTAGVDCSADLGGQHLAQLHTPLVKAVDAPDEALHSLIHSFVHSCIRDFIHSFILNV